MLADIGSLLHRTIQQYITPKKTSTALVPYVQGKQPSTGAGMHNKTLTDKQDSPRQFQPTWSLVSPSLLPVSVEQVAWQSSHHAISTRTATGQEIMGSEILLWHYPEKKNIVNGSPLIVASNQFCALKVRGLIFRVYETGQYRVRTPDVPFSSSTQQTFNGQSSHVENEALYVNRGQLICKVSGVAISREKARVEYSVKYAIHLDNRKDVLRLVQHMANQSHPLGQSQGLDTGDVNTAARPIIERTVNKLVQGTLLGPAGSNQGQQMPDPSQLMYERLQSFLSTYGFTVDKVKVRIGSQLEEDIQRRPLLLKDFDLRNRVETTAHLLAIPKYTSVHHLKPQQENREPEVHRNSQNGLDRYEREMTAIPVRLVSDRTGSGQRGVMRNAQSEGERLRSEQL